MKNICRAICACAILLFASQVYGYEADIPQGFVSRKEALKSGCTIVTLKEKGKVNCVYKTFDGHDLLIAVYDSNGKGGFSKKEQFKITSWYQKAKVKYEDVFGDEKKFIHIEFEGNAGTGTLQTILMLVGWKENRFVPVLFETVDYYVDYGGGDLRELAVKYKLIKQKNPIFEISYDFGSKKPFLEKKWSDSLVWDEKTFSFYDKELEQKKIKSATSFVQKDISNVRLGFLEGKVKLDRLESEKSRLDNIQIMGILDDE